MVALSVRAVGMVSSVGNSALECAASVRAALSRFADTSVMTRSLGPLRMALVADDALLDAAHRIATGEADAVLVVAAGTRLDLMALDDLQRAGRLLVDDAMEGFVPGEGAAALCVTAATDGGLATITQVGVGSDPFTPDGEEPMTAQGLTRALQDALATTGAPASELWLGLNGESWNAREWGIAARRCHGLVVEHPVVRHPVDCFGDPEAALGAMQLCLAATFLHRGWSTGPALVWNFSDDGLRGAARLVAPGDP